MGADCKSAARATLVQIQLGPFMKNNASWSFFRAHSNPIRLCSSVVEHFIGNEEVTGSIPVKGLITNALLVRLLQIKLCCSGYFAMYF
jgi:hypothetical protein